MTQYTRPRPTLGDAPIEAIFRKKMNEIAHAIDRSFNGELTGKDRKVGFILQIFPFDGHEGRCNYISNADRKDVIVMLKEQIRRFEGQPEIKSKTVQ